MAEGPTVLEFFCELDEARARYFALTVTSTISSATLKFPATFRARHGWPGEEDCCLCTSIRTINNWPLQMKRLHDTEGGFSVVSVGPGWPRFLEAHNSRVGAFLTFEMVDKRCLVVSIHRRSNPAGYPVPQAGPVRISRGVAPTRGLPPKQGDGEICDAYTDVPAV
ncbi:hypothetical protein M758_UG091100 [Ceratodon purpureus]|nr:hypothetical protein M758_UG091100 [Ceratodon purpureus]